MLSSLLRPTKQRQRVSEHSSQSTARYGTHLSPNDVRRPLAVRHALADFSDSEGGDDESPFEEGVDDAHINVYNDAENEHLAEDDDDEDDEDGDEEDSPLLPIFSAAHLDALPVYSLTHSIRLIVLPRCETTLTWDQLRSPQVSQFLIKPMQQQIRTSHFSRATLYALMTNALQFGKEAHMNPGSAGNSRTRAMVCEILATKLLKEYNTRELIDALSYDFFPLQGLSSPSMSAVASSSRPAAARISTLEVAIRAQSKRFLAHPLVVQQLEAIWAGTIVFHSAADSMHRTPAKSRPRTPVNYGTNQQSRRASDRASHQKHQMSRSYNNNGSPVLSTRRTVTLYDPRDASLFKLSRLRVPRYRQVLSTFSLAILLGLFLAVLIERSLAITTLEVVFWFWSAGFMLDEVVGFNEQGFSLYIMNFWNIFDLGILMLLIIYYTMRIYGVFLVDVGRHEWNDMAYDVLASTAVLLFPRLFSALDHYRYFSQLLIAFRLMAIDLIAVFILILIACSGFFVAFTLSFNQDYQPGLMAYRMLQLLLGFTPAAWEIFATYTFLGKTILVLFLFISHFLIVTILITVLTNSFMAIASNANDEHQFVFAVNTISMVRNDALFSYVAPSNVLAWALTPWRFILPFRQYVKLNRYVIKATHFPLLFMIYGYEKWILARGIYVPTDLVENHGRSLSKRILSLHDPTARPSMFSPNIRARQESVAGFQKDRALDEVFQLAPRADIRKRTAKNAHAVSNWMEQNEGTASPPAEQDLSIVDRLERRRNASRTTPGSSRRRLYSRDFSRTRSVASDPAEFMHKGGYITSPYHESESSHAVRKFDREASHTDADGDDERATHDEDEVLSLDQNRRATKNAPKDDSDKENGPIAEEQTDYFQTPTKSKRLSQLLSTSVASSHRSLPKATASPPKSSRRRHVRNLSTNTILFNPVANPDSDDSSSSSGPSKPRSRPLTARHIPSGTQSPLPTSSTAGRRSPKNRVLALGRSTAPSSNTPETGSRSPQHQPRPSAARPILPPRSQFISAPNRAALQSLDARLALQQQYQQHPYARSSAQPAPNHSNNNINNNNGRQVRRHHRASSMDFDLTSDAGLPDAHAALAGAVPSSFNTQMALATGMVKNFGPAANTGGSGGGNGGGGGGDDDGDGADRIMGRLMLARMKTLEETFQEVVREVKGIKKSGAGGGGSPPGRESRGGSGGGNGGGGGGGEGRRDKGKRPLRRKNSERPQSLRGGADEAGGGEDQEAGGGGGGGGSSGRRRNGRSSGGGGGGGGSVNSGASSKRTSIVDNKKMENAIAAMVRSLQEDNVALASVVAQPSAGAAAGSDDGDEEEDPGRAGGGGGSGGSGMRGGRGSSL